MKSGELIVTGANEVQVELKGQPIRLEVKFSDSEDIIVPCDPHFNDTLEWTIQNNILTIRWVVNGIREIKWKVWFYWSEIKI